VFLWYILLRLRFRFARGELRFKRALCKKGLKFESATSNDRPRIFNSFVDEELVPLGKFETEEGYLLVFPNCHIHKIAKLVNTAASKTASRKIIVFFVVNPEKRTISTKEIAPQQGLFSLCGAKAYRLELMAERKYEKGKLNVREVELCEH